MAISQPMNSSFRVALDLSLKQFEPKGTIMDVESCQQFLRDFHRYKYLGGSKKFSTLLQVPLDPKVAFISNFLSLLYGFNTDFLLDDIYVENQLLQSLPRLFPLIMQLKMADTNKSDPAALIRFLHQFLGTFSYHGSGFKKNFSSDLHWNKALRKLFCSLICPSDLPTRLSFLEIIDFNSLQLTFRKTVMQLQTSQQLLGKPASSVTVACRNCKLPHNISECKKNCTYSTCANSPPHQAKGCVNWKSTKSKHPPSISSTVSLSSLFSPAYVVRNYETVHFTNKCQLVRFFMSYPVILH